MPCHSFIRPLVQSSHSLLSLIHAFIHSFISIFFIHSLHSFHSFIHSFFVFIHSYKYALNIYSFVPLFMSFHSFVPSCLDRSCRSILVPRRNNDHK